MPPLDDFSGENNALDPQVSVTPTDGTSTDTTSVQTEAAQDAAPQSSGGQDTTDTPVVSGEPKDLAEAISAAFKAGAEKPLADEKDATDPNAPKTEDDKQNTDADPAKSTKGTVEETGSESELSDPTDEEMQAYKPQVQKRVKQLLSQRNEFRRQAEAMQPDATNYRQIRDYMTQNSLEDKEVAELFELGAHLKSGDPARLAKFVERAMPTLNLVLEALGHRVPQDLNEQVERGDMTEDVAKRLARERHNAALANERANRAAQQAQQVQSSQTTGVIREAVNTWEQNVRLSDPDFDKKAPVMARFAQALVAERGHPKTPQEAIEFSKRVYSEVNDFLKSTRPAPAPTRQTAPQGGSANSRSGASPTPTSLEEIVKLGLAMGPRA